MNIVEMRMMAEYYKTHSPIDGREIEKSPSFYEKQEWLKDNVSTQELTEYAFDNSSIINILYEHFHN